MNAIDAPSPQTMLQQPAERREVKFIIGGVDVATIAGILKVNAKAVRFGREKVSWVNSIYFDDHHNSACRESLAGVSQRTKVRLRWYDKDFSQQTFFELKQRDNQTRRKQRYSVQLDKPLQEFRYSELVDRLSAVLPGSAAVWLQLRSEPKVLVSYRRQHFCDRHSTIRITLDYDIQLYNQCDCRSPSRRFGIRLSMPSLVEVKGPAVEQWRIQRLLHPLRPRICRFSKYVSGFLAVTDSPLKEAL